MQIKKRKEEKMKKGNPIRVIIVFAIFVLACVGAFFYLSNREEEEPVETDHKVMTVVQEVLSRNLDTNYPPTPKEVLKYYSEITRCFYSEKYTDEELDALAIKSRELFDQELFENQSAEQYLAALKRDIEDYKEANRVISSYSVSSSTDVNEYSYDGREWAQLYCIYSLREGTTIIPIQERFLMRKDENGHWKILGWELAEQNEEEE